MRLLVLGLRRSGTTVFMQYLNPHRADTAFFDEPFGHQLVRLPADHPKNTWGDFRKLYLDDPVAWRRRYRCIEPADEPLPDLSPDHLGYLEWLLASRTHVLVDETRLAFKIRVLAEHLRDVHILHLHRAPAAWATSHLIPSASSWLGRLRRRVDAHRFWTRRTGFDRWHLESVIRSARCAMAQHELDSFGIDPTCLEDAPAVEALLAFWRLAFDTVERDGPNYFGPRFRSMAFEHFTQDPAAAVEEISEWCGTTLGAPRPPHVHRAAAAYRANDPRWEEVGARVGLGQAELHRPHLTQAP